MAQEVSLTGMMSVMLSGSSLEVMPVLMDHYKGALGCFGLPRITRLEEMTDLVWRIYRDSLGSKGDT
jgi:hypothetical protein